MGRWCNTCMTDPDRREEQESQEDRQTRLRRLVEEGREAELDEDDYQFALENGLIEG